MTRGWRRAQIADRARGADVVYLGEQHDNPTHHAHQRAVVEALVARGVRPALGVRDARGGPASGCRSGARRGAPGRGPGRAPALARPRLAGPRHVPAALRDRRARRSCRSSRSTSIRRCRAASPARDWHRSARGRGARLPASRRHRARGGHRRRHSRGPLRPLARGAAAHHGRRLACAQRHDGPAARRRARPRASRSWSSSGAATRPRAAFPPSSPPFVPARASSSST